MPVFGPLPRVRLPLFTAGESERVFQLFQIAIVTLLADVSTAQEKSTEKSCTPRHHQTRVVPITCVHGSARLLPNEPHN